MTVTDVPTVGLVGHHGLAFPATALSQDGGPTAPVGVPPAMRQPRRHRVPTSRGFGPLPRADPWGQMRQEATVARGGLDAFLG